MKMQPLRQRRGDLPKLVDLLVTKHASLMRRDSLTFSPDALAALADYDWPGNIRELENLVMRLVAISPGKTIVTDDIPTEYCLPTLNRLAEQVAHDTLRGAEKEQRLYFLAREQFERYIVRLTVRRFGGNKKRAARELGVSFSTVKEKMRDRGEPALPE
jgi:DNA-binding NtrC family response regulator